MGKEDFVAIDKDIGVVIAVELENNIPEDHLGIWFGEKDELNNPLYRTVPIKYCTWVKKIVSYH